MDTLPTNEPRRSENRIILQFDYDCFYAQVVENRNPGLKSQPLGIKQKNILATCNYNARRLGIKKLMLISEAKSICPNLVIVEGEDLTPFRDTSKVLFNYLRSHSWNGKVERLGFDEVFMDVTDMVEYNLLCLNKSSMASSFFCLSRNNPELGFGCDLTSVAGCVVGSSPTPAHLDEPAYLRLLLGSHLGQHLRNKLEEDFGYTSTCGISTSKLLSKLAGSKNKPRNQTTLVALNAKDVCDFVDEYRLRQIPGMGAKIVSLMETYITSKQVAEEILSFDSTVTAFEARTHPEISPALLEKLLGGPGAERGVGARVWGLLHGVDSSEVKQASGVPSQISIEDTYKGLETVDQIADELHKLSYSLIRRMRIDLVLDDENNGPEHSPKWIALPKTLRLSVRSWPSPGSGQSQRDFSRISRSTPLPSLVFDLKKDIGDLSHQLVSSSLLPLLRKLQGNKSQKWNLQLINICVANMTAGAAPDKTGAGRDIAVMFKQQDEVLRPWRVTSCSDSLDDESTEEPIPDDDEDPDLASGFPGHPVCAICGHSIPEFALPAHLRFHELEGSACF